MCEIEIISLEEFAPEILLNIFRHLGIPDLLNLRLVCWRFCSLINSFWDQILFQHRSNFLVTNQLSEQLQQRCQRTLLPFERHRISNNWQSGRYKEENRFFHKKCIPCLKLERDILWLGRGCHIEGFGRRGHKVNLRKPMHQLSGFKSSDVCKFVVDNEHILIGNGHHLKLYSMQNEEYISDTILFDMDITCVDMFSDLMAVGSRNNKLCIFQNTNESCAVFRCKEEFDDRIWTLAFNETRLAIGTAANYSTTSIIVFDTEKCETLLKLGTEQRGAGVLDFKWESPSLLWSGGYDSFLRKWDLRVGQCVQQFPDPWMSKIYCFDYDFVNTIIAGCESNGRVVLWDIRKDKYVQMYYMRSCGRSSSPIYGLSFDAEHLFTATELHINILDFSVIRGAVHDYSDVFRVQIII